MSTVSGEGRDKIPSFEGSPPTDASQSAAKGKHKKIKPEKMPAHEVSQSVFGSEKEKSRASLSEKTVSQAETPPTAEKQRITTTFNISTIIPQLQENGHWYERRGDLYPEAFDHIRHNPYLVTTHSDPSRVLVSTLINDLVTTFPLNKNTFCSIYNKDPSKVYNDLINIQILGALNHLKQSERWIESEIIELDNPLIIREKQFLAYPIINEMNEVHPDLIGFAIEQNGTVYFHQMPKTDFVKWGNIAPEKIRNNIAWEITRTIYNNELAKIGENKSIDISTLNKMIQLSPKDSTKELIEGLQMLAARSPEVQRILSCYYQISCISQELDELTPHQILELASFIAIELPEIAEQTNDPYCKESHPTLPRTMVMEKETGDVFLLSNNHVSVLDITGTVSSLKDKIQDCPESSQNSLMAIIKEMASENPEMQRIIDRYNQIMSLPEEQHGLTPLQTLELAYFIAIDLPELVKTTNDVYLKKSRFDLPRTISLDKQAGDVYLLSKHNVSILNAEGTFKKVTSAIHLPLLEIAKTASLAAQAVTKDSLDQQDIIETKREMQIHEELKGLPGIWNLKTWFTFIKEGAGIEKVSSITDFADGSLENKVKNLSFEKLLSTSLQLIFGVNSMHSKNLVHCDLKLLNALIRGDKVGLIDFGKTFRVGTEQSSLYEGLYGTAYATAPELFLVDNFQGDFFKLDVWGLGLMLYELHFGDLPPFTNIPYNYTIATKKKKKEYYQKIMKEKIIESIEKPLKNLLKEQFKTQEDYFKILIYDLLRLDPKKRLNISDAYSELENIIHMHDVYKDEDLSSYELTDERTLDNQPLGAWIVRASQSDPNAGTLVVKQGNNNYKLYRMDNYINASDTEKKKLVRDAYCTVMRS